MPRTNEGIAFTVIPSALRVGLEQLGELGKGCSCLIVENTANGVGFHDFFLVHPCGVEFMFSCKVENHFDAVQIAVTNAAMYHPAIDDETED